MVAEAWLLKMGNQVSSNLKQALFLDPSSKNKKLTFTTSKKNEQQQQQQQRKIGILSFEVANVMSRVIHLHKSLTDSEITRLKTEILKSEGVVNVVSDEESYLVELVIAEKLDDLNRIVGVVARLGKRCVEPALHGFEHVFGDIMSGVIDVKELGFLVKDMEGMVRKMERYVNSTSNLYNESQVLNELEQTSKKLQQNQHEESRRVFEQKLTWHKQDVRHLKDVSLWNQTYDKIVGLLARTICTIFARLCTLFGDAVVRVESSGCSSEFYSAVGSSFVQNRSGLISGPIDVRRNRQMASGPLHQSASSRSSAYNSGPMARIPAERKGTPARPGLTPQRSTVPSFRPENVTFPCGASPGRLFTECLRFSSSASVTADDDIEHEGQDSQTFGCCAAGNGLRREHRYPPDCSNMVEMSDSFSGDQRQSGTACGITSTGKSPFRPKSRLMVYASASTVGGSALALHYANIIIVIEKLLRYPHLVGDEARDDLYQMLPTNLRMSLRTNLKSYAKNLSIYDAPLAHEWKETLEKKQRWLAPLAHNMIRWQTERNLEQQQIIAKTNVLLLQTLYFADREKTEAAICELLVGLNYICRYEHQQNALLDCASSFDFDDCVEWRWQDPYL